MIDPDDMTILTNTSHEIYLISADKKIRTYFRWTWKADSNAPADKQATCMSDSQVFQDGCIGTIEFLKLK